MNLEDVIHALDLPASAEVNQRVPKKLLLENGAPTAADRRYISNGIEELTWMAALKPTTVGVTEYRDDTREYIEIAVIRLILRDGAKATRLVELVHRAVPYPVLLVSDSQGILGISAAHKRWSEGEAGKTVLDAELVSVQFSGTDWKDHWEAFRDSLSLRRQPRDSLFTLYQGWIDTLLAMEAARILGVFALPSSMAESTARQDALREFGRLEVEMARLCAAAEAETQLARQVELNFAMQERRKGMAVAKKKIRLGGGSQ